MGTVHSTTFATGASAEAQSASHFIALKAEITLSSSAAQIFFAR